MEMAGTSFDKGDFRQVISTAYVKSTCVCVCLCVKLQLSHAFMYYTSLYTERSRCVENAVSAVHILYCYHVVLSRFLLHIILLNR